MRIVYVLTSLGMGGAERQVLGIAERMRRRGHTVAVLVLRPQLAQEWPTDLHVFRLNLERNPVSLCGAWIKGVRWLRGFRPDLLHSHSFHANILARLFKLALPAPRILCTVHNIYEGGWGRMLAYRLTDALCWQSTAVSDAVAERFVRVKAIPSQKCIVVTNGIDATEFSPSIERRAEMRAAMGVASEFIWMAAGRNVPAKDYPNLLRAFARVRKERPDAELWIAGGGNSAGSTVRDGMTGNCGEFDSVRWLGLRRDLPALLDAADGFVLASAWEGMPLVVAEAMAMQKPVVATDVGGVRELVGEAGILVAARDSKALADGMLAIMNRDANMGNRMGCAARERILEGFSMDAREETWEALYGRHGATCEEARAGCA